MNTHILIPITEVLEEAIRTGDTDYLYNAVFKGKQIFLDEENIKEKSFLSAQQNYKTKIGGEYLHFIDGYKQALKDLL